MKSLMNRFSNLSRYGRRLALALLASAGFYSAGAQELGFVYTSQTCLEGQAGPSNRIVNVELKGATVFPVSVEVQLGGNATYNSDFNTNPGGSGGFITLNFNSNMVKTIEVTVNGDVTNETDEFVTLALQNATGATIVDAQSLHTITIFNDDPDCSENVTGLTVDAIAMDGTSADISWTGTGNATEYLVHWRILGISGWGNWGTMYTGNTFATLSSLTPATYYQFRVSPVCGLTPGTFTDQEMLYTVGTAVDCSELPTGLVAGPGTDFAHLDWNATTNATHYNVQYKAVSEQSWKSSNPLTNTFDPVGLLPNTEYQWRVRARCGSPVSDYVDGPNFTTLASGASLATVGFVGVGGSALEDNNDWASYNSYVELKGATTFPVTVSIRVNSNGTYSTDYTTSPAGSSGTIQLKFYSNGVKPIAIKVKGDALVELNEEVNLTILEPVVPGSVLVNPRLDSYHFTIINDDADCSQAATGLNVTGLTDNSATLNWTGTVNANFYKVRYRVVGVSGINSWSSVSGIVGTSTTISGLTSGTLYEFNVIAYCGGLPSTGSATVRFATTGAAPACGVPANTNEMDILTNKATLTWDAVSGASYYQVYYRVNGNTTWVGPYSALTNTLTLSGLTVNTNYDWRVRARCGTNPSAYATDNFSTSAGVRMGNTETAEAANVTLYPNPNKGSFSLNFEVAEAGVVAYRIIDLSGREVMKNTVETIEGMNRIDVQMNEAVNGLYLFEMQTPSGVVSTRFMVN